MTGTANRAAVNDRSGGSSMRQPIIIALPRYSPGDQTWSESAAPHTKRPSVRPIEIGENLPQESSSREVRNPEGSIRPKCPHSAGLEQPPLPWPGFCDALNNPLFCLKVEHIEGVGMKHQRHFDPVEAALKQATQIVALIGELSRRVEALEYNIAAEEKRAKVSCPSNRAYPVTARSLGAQRDNLKRTIEALERCLAQSRD
jgi:hypothetical protein